MTINVATEDELSEAIALKLVAFCCPNLSVGVCLRRDGYGYLRSNMKSFKQMARRQYLLLITDLDQTPCPLDLVRSWTKGTATPEKLIFRVAVREIESWLMADHQALRLLLGKHASLPELPDDLQDPKATLLRLATRAPREIRNDLVKARDSVASQGLGYTNRLKDLVKHEWSPERAAERSTSLQRALARLYGIPAI